MERRRNTEVLSFVSQLLMVEVVMENKLVDVVIIFFVLIVIVIFVVVVFIVFVIFVVVFFYCFCYFCCFFATFNTLRFSWKNEESFEMY